MLKKANLDWNARQLCKLVQKREIKFDNAVQRGLVWDAQRKSLLIHSIIKCQDLMYKKYYIKMYN